MSSSIFTSPEEAESAFYAALARADLDGMMAVWSEDEEVVCVHPGSIRLIGLSAIRESWRQLFESGTRLIIRPSRPVQWLNVMTAVHTVHQHVHIDGDHRLHPPIIATNVFSRGAVGWKMVLHHASPRPTPTTSTAATARTSSTDAPASRQLPRAGLAARRPRPDHLAAALQGPLPRLQRERWAPPTATSSTSTGCPTPRRPAGGALPRAGRLQQLPYARSLMRHLAAIGWNGVVPHFRGCSGEPNRQPRAYHAGDADEIGWILARLAARHPGAPRYAAGVSWAATPCSCGSAPAAAPAGTSTPPPPSARPSTWPPWGIT
jgi:ketosteroid isomerase-like protein